MNQPNFDTKGGDAGVPDKVDGVDLTNCDREPIHIPGCIQPHGVMFVLDASDLSITQVSSNLQNVIGFKPEELLSKPVGYIVNPDYRELLEKGLRDEMISSSNPLQIPIEIQGRQVMFDGMVSQIDSLVLLELENPHQFQPTQKPTIMPIDVHYRLVRKAVTEMHGAARLEDVCDMLVRQVRDFTGFDRVMAYRFSDDGHGSVIAEIAREGLKPFIGLHFPATDIPKQARKLYEKNWLRLITDVNYEPAALIPPINPTTEQPLDMSTSVLRSVSPVHLEYLKNMGVSASASISLLSDGKLWGLIACHHHSPKFVPYEVRAGAELLGCVMSMQLTTKTFSEQANDRSRQQSFQATLLEKISKTKSVLSMTDDAEALLKMVDARGATVLFNGEFRSIGVTPGDDQIIKLVKWLRSQQDSVIFSTDSLSNHYSAASEFADSAAGLLAVTLSRFRDDYVLFFRPEVEQTVSWAGNPEKPVEVSDDGEETLSPRKSFETWRQTVKNQSLPWRDFETQLARELRNSLVTFIIQRAEELEELNKELLRSNIELDSFAYVASHDLKEPLRGINGFAHYISENHSTSLTDNANEKVDGVMRLTKRMDDLLDSLLHFSRVGRVELMRKPTAIETVLTEALEMIGQSRVEDGGVIEVPRPLPVLKCDATRVREVFTNLIVNGLRYNRSDKPSVEVGFLDTEQSEYKQQSPVVLYVRDNGIGIKEMFHDRIFQMFKRLHSPDKFGEGTGAGLTIVRKIVERHGGRVWLESELGRGSTFYFTLEPENVQQ